MNAFPFHPRPLVAFAFAVFALIAPALRAAPATPPAPVRHFQDQANFVPAARAQALDARLARFERDTSNQLLVVIYPRLPAGASLEDYTVRTAHAWGVGQKARDNGAVLFIFAADRLLRIEAGYGLEGTLTDATCHAIIENELKPRLRAGDNAGALDAAVTAMIAATAGEYRGTGRTHHEVIGGSRSSSSSSSGGGLFVMIVFIILAVVFGSKGSRGHSYGSPYHRRGYGGGSWGGGSGGGFSGGGGGFGGGGASGKW